MDRVEALLEQARPILKQAGEACNEAAQIPDLPQYMQERLVQLNYMITNAIRRPVDSVASVRRDIPASALAAEQERGKQNTLGM